MFVTPVFKDAEIREAWAHRETLRDAVRRRLRELLPDRWPFVVFSAESPDTYPEGQPSRQDLRRAARIG